MGCSCSSPSQAPQAQAPGRPPKDVSKAPDPAAPGALMLPGTLHSATTEPVSDASPIPPCSHATSAPAIRASGSSAVASPSNLDHDAEGGHRGPRLAKTLPASGLSVESNGFKAVPELPSFTISEANIAPFTMPAEAFRFQPPEDALVSKFKNGDSERKIHLNTKLTESEIDRLAQMRQVGKVSGAAFYPSVSAMATRFLSRARMDPEKAVALMKATQNWRANYFKDGPVTDASILDDMKHGIVYFSGRDFALRPAIIVRANRIPEQWYKDKCIDRFIRMLIFCMEYFTRYMVVPGRIENLNVIVDLHSLGISQVPISALSEVYSVMSHHYIGRVYKFYVCNVSWVLGTIAGMAKAILTDRQKQKLNMLDNVKELQKDFALHQLETDLGGTLPIFKEFLPFPLQPGPFEAGYAGGPDPTAQPGAHNVLSHLGALGRLWDPKRTKEENTRLEYAAGAADLLERLGLPVPPEARLEAEASNHAKQEASESHEARATQVPAMPLPVEHIEVGKDDVILADAEVSPSGRFEPIIEGPGSAKTFCC